MKTYNDNIETNEEEWFSLNFLMAELEEIPEIGRDLKIIETRIQCDEFETNDFKPRAYYKHISSPVKLFSNDDTPR